LTGFGRFDRNRFGARRGLRRPNGHLSVVHTGKILSCGEAVLAEIILNKADVPDNGAKIVEAGDRLKVAVFRVGDRVAAIDNRCPHAGAELGLGDFDGTTVKCPLHGFRVDVWKGAGTAGKPHKTFPVAMVGDEIRVTVPDAVA
jgi:nitrite reductase/ring-hydroxylating ferredoxin subunit